MSPVLSVIVTFHQEGILAHAALRSYLLARASARTAGIEVELVLVLDNADAETLAIVCGHPELLGDEVLVMAAVGDAALARNQGIAQATGKYLCTLDGDDLISRDYFQRHVQLAERTPGRVILHPQVVVSFGMDSRFTWQLDQRTMPFSPDLLLSENPWISAVFARREVFTDIPYVACLPRQTGFGYEDWHWNCQTVAAGYEHVAVADTAYFYRLKPSGSVNTSSSALGAVMPPSDLFGRWVCP
ncbi:glycosyltransferase [Stenotrophomonas sp.]|uniref:glycosyltransferase n=1 Tax=Stenotrophomonas sp. TaxID=69392 RepID=UPI002FC871D3